MATTQPTQGSFKVSDFSVVASGLDYPEGPVWRPDHTLLVCEVGSGQLRRVHLDTGAVDVVATLGGGANGCAVGPDGAIYVCNDGGCTMIRVPQGPPNDPNDPVVSGALAQISPSYSGGKIQRIDTSGNVTDLYTTFKPLHGSAPMPLRSPDDLTFDSHGGFWFTDWGKVNAYPTIVSGMGPRTADVTGIYYAKADGSSCEEVAFPRSSPNGIALSPDEKRLYVAETWTRQVIYYELSDHGKIKPNPRTLPDGSYLLTAAIPFQAALDSMSIDEDGNLYVVSILPHGWDANTRGGITVISPPHEHGGEGKILDWIEIDIGQKDPLPSNICFGDDDRRTAFITLGGTGRVVSCRMRYPGKKPAYL
jgi:gluconolactonase